ncbi:DUF1601 domain-containing protein [Endozoicomonas sp. ALE010]|uniref:DUF1601 domain-containing protein n=1 Tax=Endozoicomonas sp. ALE010 TaxID=3403081 RepID=UPI003BB68898
MHKISAGISGKYARPGNGHNQPDDHAASSRLGRYIHATVRQWDNAPRSTPERNEFYHSSAACSSLQHRSVNPAQDFNDLIKQEIMDDLVSKSDYFGHRYDGRHHGQYANSIKKYTSAAKRPLNRAEQSQLIRLLQNFTATRSWNWRSLTTTFHSFTSSGVFTHHKPMDERIKLTQAHLLSTLLDAITFKCNQKPQARDIDDMGIANLLWAMAKLVDNRQAQTTDFNVAVAALLPHVNVLKTNFKPQGITNLLWSMAKLVDNGQERIPGLKEAVATLLHRVNAKKADFNLQQITNLLWAIAKLVDNGQGQTQGLKEAVAVLLPLVYAQKDQFNAQRIANLLWAMAKLADNGQKRTPEFNEAVNALLPHVNAQKDQFNPQGIANLLWAIVKLVDNGLKRTPEFKEAVAVLLPCVNAQKANFKPQGIANLLWVMVKLPDIGQEPTPELNEAVTALLPYVKVQKANFKPQGTTNLLWAMAKLADNGQERVPEFNEAMTALLPYVKAQKDQFIPQHVANLLWALAKLLDNGPEKTQEFNEAVATLLSCVNAQKDQFIPQHITNLMWAMAKLVDNGQEWTPEFYKAVAALLPQVIAQKANFKPQEIANLLWAIAKLVDNGQEQTAQFNEAVAVLLPLVNAMKADFIAQEIANLLWATAKLADNGQEQTARFKEAMTALLPFVNALKANFNPQEIANLLWATAKPGELLELNMVTATFESLVYRISETPQLSQQDILMSIWGVMVWCARLSLISNANQNSVIEKYMDDLFTRLENTAPNNEDEQSIIALAASWLGRACPIVPHYLRTMSQPQAEFRDQLQSCIPSLKIEEEKCLNSLPPVDLLLPDHNMVIEIQGPFHYVCGDFKTRNGSTLLKIALLKKAGFEVMEIPANTVWDQDSIKPCIDQIKTREGASRLGSVSTGDPLAD